MANPNIVNVTQIYGVSTQYVPSGITAVSLLNNAASSGLVYKIDTVFACNTSSSAVSATLSYYTAATAQGSAPSGGTAYPIAYQVSVPPNATVILSDKTSAFYLTENACLSITSGTANNLTFTVSYENISSS
jgi:hypothetical protein